MKKRGLCLLVSALLLSAPAHALEDGIYRDKAPGFGGDVVLTVSIRDGQIREVTTENTGGEKSEYYLKAEKALTQAIVDSQGLEGVDTVAGATGTSESIINAMRGILEQAVYTGGSEADSAEKTASLSAENLR